MNQHEITLQEAEELTHAYQNDPEYQGKRSHAGSIMKPTKLS